MHKAAEGGHIEVIRFLLPLFGERVHEKTNDSLTMLHFAAQLGHCQVARYLIEEAHMDPQDRDKVRGVAGDCAGFSIFKKAIGNPIFLAVTDIPEVSPVASIMLWLVTAYVMYPPYFQCGWTKYVHMLESFSATMQIYMSDIRSASAISCPLGLSSQQTKTKA